MAPAPDPHEVARWVDSGAGALTGRPGGPLLGPPAGLLAALDRLARPFPGLDPLGLLTDRAAFAGLSRQGRTSCGGSCRLLSTADGWLAVSLPRPADVELLPAWLEEPIETEGDAPPWAELEAAVRHRSAAALDERAALLGLAVGHLGTATGRPGVVCTPLGAAPPRPRLDGVQVVDLGALWAGPLCGALLASLGATVTKVESSARPDGARLGPPAFFDRLNGAKRAVTLDLETTGGRSRLADLVAQADVVIESSRPRALRHLGIDAAAVVAAGGPQVWAAITGHGRDDGRHEGRDAGPGRIGFGDDAAVAGGLVASDGSGPVFCADAIADPCSGLAAAAACVEALAEGGRWLLDVSLAHVAADLRNPTDRRSAG